MPGTQTCISSIALLFTQQIDSAYWKYRELFDIPDGIQLNLVLNFLLLMVAKDS